MLCWFCLYFHNVGFNVIATLRVGFIFTFIIWNSDGCLRKLADINESMNLLHKAVLLHLIRETIICVKNIQSESSTSQWKMKNKGQNQPSSFSFADFLHSMSILYGLCIMALSSHFLVKGLKGINKMENERFKLIILTALKHLMYILHK